MSVYTTQVQQILEIVCRATGITEKEMLSKSRERRIVIPRQVFCWLAAKYSNESLVEIARFLGGKHHTTIMHSIQQVNDKIDIYDEATMEVMDICVNLMRQDKRDTYIIEVVLPSTIDVKEVEQWFNDKYILHKIV
jgi:hypothetical protein